MIIFGDPAYSPLGARHMNMRFQNVTGNDVNIEVDADPDAAATVWANYYGGSYNDYLDSQEDFNATQWLKQTAYATTVFGLQWILEKNRIDDRAEKFAEMREAIVACGDAFCDEAEALLDTLDENAPSTPQAAEYVPVDCCEVFRDTIECNIQNSDLAEELADLINSKHLEKDIERMVFIDNKYQEKADLISCQIADLLNGKLPISDQVENAEDSCGRSMYAGSLGGACRTRRQDLGISELRANREGFERELAFRQSNDRISPIERQFDMRSTHKNPAQAMQWALLQAELIQQSLQNVYNLAAVPDPTIFDRINARLAKATTCMNTCLAAATTRSNEVLNLNAFAQPLISSIASGVRGLTGYGINSMSSWGNQVQQQQVATPMSYQQYSMSGMDKIPSQWGYNNYVGNFGG